MRFHPILFLFLFPLLVVFVGIPLLIKQWLTGTQEGRLLNFYCRIFGDA